MSCGVCVYSHPPLFLIHLSGKGNYCQGRTLSCRGDHCMSYMTGFCFQRQSIWVSTGFQSRTLFFTVALNIISFIHLMSSVLYKDYIITFQLYT